MTDFSHRFRTLRTNLIHAGSPRPNVEGAVVTPVFQSANYLMEADATTYDAVRYIRRNPRWAKLRGRDYTLWESGRARAVE